MTYVAFHEVKQEQERQAVKIADGEKSMTLEELARKLCNSLTNDDSYDACYDGTCPAAAYCRHGHNGMIDWLRKVVNE